MDSRDICSDLNQPNKQLHCQETHTQTHGTTKTDCPTLQPESREQNLPASGNLGMLFASSQMCNSDEYAT